MMRNFIGGLLAAMVLNVSALAVPSVDYQLFIPDPVNHPGRIRVDVNYTADNPTDRLTLVQFFVTEDPFNGGTTGPAGNDYSRFSFTDDAGLANWDPIIRTEIDNAPGGVVSRNSFAPDAAVVGLMAGTTTIGVIDVNLAGLAPGSVHTIKLGLLGDLLGTVAGFLSDPTDDATFALIDGLNVSNSIVAVITVPQQQLVVVPEPATTGLALMAVSLAGLSRRWRSGRN